MLELRIYINTHPPWHRLMHKDTYLFIHGIHTHLEIWLTGWSHLNYRGRTLTAATYTCTSPVADTLVQINTVSHWFEIHWHVRWHNGLITKKKELALLTPLLSRQVWLLLGHSQALPVQPSAHEHWPITQEPRSDKRRKNKIELFYHCMWGDGSVVVVKAEIPNRIKKLKIRQLATSRSCHSHFS